jgi:putative membrane protein
VDAVRLLRLIGAGLALAALPAQAHHPAAAQSTGIAWTIALLGASAALHALGTARLWRRAGYGRGIGAAALARWWSGWLVLAFALLSPLDTLGAQLFSAHMVQHELLMVVAAPLLVTGRPLEAWAWAIAPRWRSAIAHVRLPALSGLWVAATDAPGAWCLHALALWAWHVPALFAASLADEAIHALQHASFLGTALLFWWSVLPRPGFRAGGAALASVFTTMMHTSALGALLTFAPRAGYAGPGAAAYGLTALEDQQLGGLVMWVPGGMAYLVAGLLLVAGWLRSSPAAASSAAAGTRGPAPRAHPRRA